MPPNGPNLGCKGAASPLPGEVDGSHLAIGLEGKLALCQWQGIVLQKGYPGFGRAMCNESSAMAPYGKQGKGPAFFLCHGDEKFREA